MYIKENITYQERKTLFLDLKGVDSFSIKILKEEYNTNKNIIITAIYQPTNINIKDFIFK